MRIFWAVLVGVESINHDLMVGPTFTVPQNKQAAGFPSRVGLWVAYRFLDQLFM